MSWMTRLFALGCVALILDAQTQLSPSQKTTEEVVRVGSFELDTSARQSIAVLYARRGTGLGDRLGSEAGVPAASDRGVSTEFRLPPRP
jgi:hypothetical protein